jgi:hypothetical protein
MIASMPIFDLYSRAIRHLKVTIQNKAEVVTKPLIEGQIT